MPPKRMLPVVERTISEHLQPSLLDRLTDDEPEKSGEAPDRRVIDINRLRDIVRRDLSWLLNATSLGSALDSERYPHVANSVLNYGVPDPSGGFSTEERAHGIRRMMQAAIRRFEPRINEGTLDIQLRQETDGRQCVVAFDIVADMWAEPIPLSLYLRSEIDITTGEVTLEEQR